MSVDDADWSGLRDPTQLDSLFPHAREHKLTAPAHTGVAVLLHHSLFHRGTARLSDPSDNHPWRPMFKFIFSSDKLRLCARAIWPVADLIVLTLQGPAPQPSPHGTLPRRRLIGIVRVYPAGWKALVPRFGGG